MTALEGALLEVASALESLSIPYMLIGGLAVSLWGEARATLDADVLIWVEPDCIGRTVADLQARLAVDPRDPVAFVRDTRVLPARSSQGVRIDIVFGVLPWEKEAIARAPAKQIAGKTIRVASVEDLILMKIASDRSKDNEDAVALLRRHAGSLDRQYLQPLLAELSQSLSRPDILETFRKHAGLS